MEWPWVEDLAKELDIEIELEFEKIKWEMLEFDKVDGFQQDIEEGQSNCSCTYCA